MIEKPSNVRVLAGLFSRYWLLLIVFAFGLFVLSGVNAIPTMDEGVKAAQSEILNQYQRRMDLLPNLIEVVKGSANFEQETLTRVIDARASATRTTLTAEALKDPEALKAFSQKQDELGSALARLLVVSEKYPDLKANQNFLDLQSQIEGSENRIAIARRDYIYAVQVYNTQLRTFPGIIWAQVYGALPKTIELSTQVASDRPPAVKF